MKSSCLAGFVGENGRMGVRKVGMEKGTNEGKKWERREDNYTLFIFCFQCGVKGERSHLRKILNETKKTN